MFKKSKQFLTATVVVAILFTMMVIASAWTPVEPPPYDLEYARSDNGVLPFLVEADKGNFDDPVTGMYNQKYDVPDGGHMGIDDDNPERLNFYDDESNLIFSVWLSRDADDKLYIMEWQSFGIEVHYIITKGGPDFFVYEYDGMMDEDKYLMNPRVGSEDQNMSGLSNFSFYWTPEPEETTTEETTTEETTTEATTAEETTTEATTAEETTTEATPTEEPTTEVITATEGPVPLAEATTEATTETTTTEAATQETLQLSEEEIPQTGQTGNSVIIGSTLLALASSLFYILRRKKSIIE